MGDYKKRTEKYNIFCNLHDKPLYISADNFHEHHTVSFKVEFESCDKDAYGAAFLPQAIEYSEYGEAHRLIDEIIKVHTLSPEQALKTQGLFLELISEYSGLAASHIGENDKTVSLYVMRAKRYIYENLNRPITQRELAEELNITPEYLCYVFKKAGEPSPIAFINRIKLARIRSVMKSENLKLYEATEMFGFADPNYVSRLYKKYYGRNITDFSDKKQL